MPKSRALLPQAERLRPALSWSMARLMSKRRLRREIGAAAVVALSVALTVAASMAVVCMVSQNGDAAAREVATPSLPAGAIIIFDSAEEAVSALEEAEGFEGIANLRRFPWANADTRLGPLFVLGALASVERGTLLCGPALAEEAGEGSSLEVWDADTGSLLGTWTVRSTGEYLPEGEYPEGWAWVSTDSLGHENLSGIAFDVTGDPSVVLSRVIKLSRSYPGAKVFMDGFTRHIVRKAALRAYLPWQAVSVMVALTAASAVSCVLAVSFLGRKRALGILKVIGATRPDLRRLVLAECWYLGYAGIPVGLVIGFALCKLGLSAPVPAAAFPASAVMGALALAGGALLPLRLTRNATCDQLLNNKAIYAFSNPSCAQCGLCGGF